LELQREKILEYMLNIVNAEYKEIAWINYAGSMQGPNYAGSGWFGARPMQGSGYGSFELQREQI
jgi:hypothetical protein